MRKYIKKCITVFALSTAVLFTLYGCKKETAKEEEQEQLELEEDGEEEEPLEEVSVVSGEYVPQSNKFKLPLPEGNWTVDREEETGTSLQSEDGQSYFEIAYLTKEESEGAMGEIPKTQKDLEDQILVGEVQPTIVSFERTEKGSDTQTIYTLKYSDGDYPYMTQSMYESGDAVYSIIGMTKSKESSAIDKIQEKIAKFELLNK